MRRRNFLASALVALTATLTGEKGGIVLMGIVEEDVDHLSCESRYAAFPNDTQKGNAVTERLWGPDASGRKMEFTITTNGFSGRFVD